MARVVNTDYQRFQYFFSDSKWDLQAIKDKRLGLIERQLTTASTNEGLLAILTIQPAQSHLLRLRKALSISTAHPLKGKRYAT